MDKFEELEHLPHPQSEVNGDNEDKFEKLTRLLHNMAHHDWPRPTTTNNDACDGCTESSSIFFPRQPHICLLYTSPSPRD